MSEKKGWGSSVLGLFVVRDDENAEHAPDAATGDATAATGTEAPADAALSDAGATFAQEPPAAPGGKVDFAAVYQAAGISPDEQARVGKAAELLHSLPG